jgi:Flp pilus assembly protein TadD
MLTNSETEASASSAFLTFLRRAVEARENGTAQTEASCLEAAAKLHPVDDNSLEALLTALFQQQRHREAVELAAIIAQLDPHRATTHFRHGYALQLANRHAEAIAPYRRALAIEPTLRMLRNNLACALLFTGSDKDEQVALLKDAVRDSPGESEGWINLANVYRAKLDLPRSLEAGARAVQCAPGNALAHNNYALTLREAQRWEDAVQAAAMAHSLAPGDPDMRSNLAMLELLRGNYARGWPLHEARWDGSMELVGQRPALPAPPWRGEPLAGKTLLVWGEQGMGDVLQFCRYIPMLAKRVHAGGGRLIWNSFPQLGALLPRSLGSHVDSFSAGGGVDSLPAFDYEIPLLSLPWIFDTREDTIPATSPYLCADAAASASWKKRLARESRLKVGLTWTGSLGHQRNPFRRIDVERYAAHFGGLQNVAFYSLQPGASVDVAAARAAGLQMADYTAEFASFDETAAFIGALDLVITVCTSAAHLSGALGQRTWVLLDVNPHWVWLLDRTDSPWYSSATLYRQPEFGQWDAVLETVARDLGLLADQHRSA